MASAGRCGPALGVVTGAGPVGWTVAEGLAAAGEASAVAVFPESLHSYSEPDRPMTDEGPRATRGAHAGERMVKPVLAGKSLLVIGDAGLPWGCGPPRLKRQPPPRLPGGGNQGQ